jgi:thiamine-phosphate pyrophosphorylase
MVIPSGVVVLTDRRLTRGPLVEVLAAARPDWVILRERDLPVEERRALADGLRAVLPDGRLIVAGPDPLGGEAVHLAARDPFVPAALVGRSCHSVPRLTGEDYVTLSPIFPTATKPGYGPALGPARAHRMAGGVPWLALGGIDSAQRAAECVAAGAAGVAVLGAVMRADDPGQMVAELRAGFADRDAAGPGRSATGVRPS